MKHAILKLVCLSLLGGLLWAGQGMASMEKASASVAGYCLPLAQADSPSVNSGAEKSEAAQRTRAFLDAPVDSRPAGNLAPGTGNSNSATYAGTLVFSGVALLVIILVGGAVFLWKFTGQEAFVEPKSPAATLPEPSLDILVPDRSDYPVLANDSFLNAIVEKGIINKNELDDLVRRFKNNAFAVMKHLAELLPSKKTVLGQLWGDSIGIAYVDPFKTEIQYEKRSLLSEDFLEKHPVLPLYEFEGVLTVATYNPKDADTIKQIENMTGKFISPVFAFPDQIVACLAIGRTTESAMADKLAALPTLAALDDEAAGGAGRSRLSASGMADFARDMVLLAVRKRASDIHIEPNEEDVVVRYRVDGILQQVMKINLASLPALVNVLKIRAGMDIAEKRRPQDGHMSIDLAGRSLDIRFSSVPTTYGEKLVLRLLGQNQFTSIPNLEDIGCSAGILRDMRRIIHSPNGVFFVTGPTGSGKTTTLYSALKAINQGGVNIMTVEDPVEYRLPGLNQVQVNTAVGVDFATALRAFLRQDPDVILVGEVRDLETAKVAAQAALTGHLVLTTMHTNNALQAITRLIQIGVEPFLVAPSIIGVMGQRLVRRLCLACREPYEMTPEEIQAIFTWDEVTKVPVYRAKGCKECNYTGYSGRIAIHELFVIDDETRDLIAHDATILDIKRTAYSKGFTTMRYDGIKKVLRGITTFEEVDFVTLESD